MGHYDRATRLRSAWLEHYHECPDCQAHQPCQVGRERIRAMRTTMQRPHDKYARESLPEWMG